MKPAAVLLCLFAILAQAAAQGAEKPRDFAYGWALDADGSEALYEVTLPAAAYRGVARADLADVRVFNGAGEVVPYAWRPRRVTGTETSPAVVLPLFPLKAAAGTAVEGLTVRVRQRAGGATGVDVVAGGKPGSSAQQVVGYIVDLTALSRPLRALDLDWAPMPDGFAGRLRVEAGDDLAQWRTLVAAAPLVSLEAGGQRLEQKRLELPRQKAKYLRLSWVGAEAGRRPPVLTAVRGEPAGHEVALAREWLAVNAGPGDKPGEYVFDLGGRFPADRARFELPQPNTVVQVELLARDKVDQPWRPVTRGVVYRLRQAGAEITSPELSLAATTDRYWLLRVDARGGGLGEGLPRLQAGWVPQRLVFAARGAPPFQLAYGNREAQPAAYAIDTLIPGYTEEAAQTIRTTATQVSPEQVVNVRALQGGTQQALGGEARREAAIDWKRWSLWGALVLGVLVLGVMAWRLSRQLSKPPPPG
ncbi:MAG: DUF3999 domain-containing protein [Burkholderiales bacterium]